MNLEDVKSLLANEDEYSICDLLGITSEDLVEQFEDRIEENYARIKKAIYWQENYE